jgi:CspA family cold shock protein
LRTGVIRSFDRARGFGLIVPEDGGPDVDVHASAVERAGISHLEPGDRVSFDVMRSGAVGAVLAVRLRLL